MGYYLTMFAQKAKEVSVTRLRQRLSEEGLEATIAADEGVDEHWEAIELQQSDGEAIAFLERLPVEPARATNAIMHAEAEGFSNIEGHQITWEFTVPQI